MQRIIIFISFLFLVSCNTNPNVAPVCSVLVNDPIEGEVYLVLRNFCDEYDYSLRVRHISPSKDMYIPDMLGGEWKLVTWQDSTKLPVVEYLTCIWYTEPGVKIFHKYGTINSTKYVKKEED